MILQCHILLLKHVPQAWTTEFISMYQATAIIHHLNGKIEFEIFENLKQLSSRELDKPIFIIYKRIYTIQFLGQNNCFHCEC